MVDLDLLNCLVVIKEVFFRLAERVSNADLILQLLPHIGLFGGVNWVLFDGDEVFNELLLCVALDVLDPLQLHLEQICLAMLVIGALADKKVEQNLENVRLQ